VTGIVITGTCGILKSELTLGIRLLNYTTSHARPCSSAWCFTTAVWWGVCFLSSKAYKR